MTFLTTNIFISQGQINGTSSSTYIDIANELNARYQTIVDSCPGGKPAHYCSGIVIRGTSYSTAFNSWDPSPNSLRLGSVSFSYLRSDTGILFVATPSGYIFTDTNTAIAQGKSLEYRCIYPINAGTSGMTVSYGCGSGIYTNDINSCDVFNITTAEQWSAKAPICSFSTKVSQKFLASLNATRKYARMYWNELLVAVWAPGTPNKLPIQAFFYTTPASLADAQHYQKDFCSSKAHRLVPIVNLTFANNPAIFSYKASDQALTSCPAS